MFFCKTLLIN